MRRKENLFTIEQMHQEFKRFYECDVSLKTYHDVLKDFNIWLREWTFKSNIFIMPYKLGKLLVNQSRPLDEFNDEGKLVKTTRRIDWVKTRQLWDKYPQFRSKPNLKYIYYENSHTDNRKMKIEWKKGHIKKVSLSFFRPCRTYQRDLAHYIFKNPNTQYYGW